MDIEWIFQSRTSVVTLILLFPALNVTIPDDAPERTYFMTILESV